MTLANTHRSTLHIQCVKKSDKGYYRCLVKNAFEESGKLSSEAELGICKSVFFCWWFTIFSSKVIFSVTANFYTADTHSEPWKVSLQNILHYIIEYSNIYDNIFKSKWPADLVICLSWEKCWSVTVCYCVHAFVLCRGSRYSWSRITPPSTFNLCLHHSWYSW